MTKEKSSYAVCVKLNPKQHSILKEASKTTGESIPEILRRSYSKKPVRAPIVPRPEALSIMKELNRLGNNVNQIARRMNSGVYLDWHPEFKTFSNEFSRMYQILAMYSRK
jgi:hypothetical protein